MVSALSADRQPLTHLTKYCQELLLRTAAYPPTGGWFQPCLWQAFTHLTYCISNNILSYYGESLLHQYLCTLAVLFVKSTTKV